jgi:hypothetical protein
MDDAAGPQWKSVASNRLLPPSLLGHADIAMALRYAHLSPGSLVTAVEKVVRRPNSNRPLRSAESGLEGAEAAA